MMIKGNACKECGEEQYGEKCDQCGKESFAMDLRFNLYDSTKEDGFDFCCWQCLKDFVDFNS